eukprot:2976559-Prymnesium_polylepis.1
MRCRGSSSRLSSRGRRANKPHPPTPTLISPVSRLSSPGEAVWQHSQLPRCGNTRNSHERCGVTHPAAAHARL